MNIEFYSNDPLMNIGMIMSFFVFLFILSVLVVFIMSLFKKRKKIYKKFEPKISIIIPTYNEENNIGKCINAILDSNYDNKKLEIICVDDGSTDRTREIIKKSIKKNENIKLVKIKHSGKVNALNAGIKKTTHDYVLVIDADISIEKKFIKEIIRPFIDKKVGATNGLCNIKNPKNPIEWFQEVEYLYNNLIRLSFSKVFGNGIWFFGAASCYRKDLLEKAGFFSKDTLTEDFDISLNLFSSGHKVIVSNNAIYYTTAMENIKKLANQRMRWFFGGLQNVKKYAKSFFIDSFAIKYLFANQIFWAIFSTINIPLIIYQVLYWLPQKNEIPIYLFRWFSIFGSINVLYNIPNWGLSFVNVFGISSGILTAFLIIISIIYFKNKISLKKIISIIFYFPYTIILNGIFVLSLIKYKGKKKKYFLK